MAPPTLPPRPPRKKIKQEIKTEPIEQVWMDQHVSNMGEEFSRPVQTIKREPNADFAAPSNIGGYLTQNPDGGVSCNVCGKVVSCMSSARRHYKTTHEVIIFTFFKQNKSLFRNIREILLKRIIAIF